MDLVNQTVAAADLYVSDVAPGKRVGYVALKVTLETNGAGGIRVADDRPLPLFDEEEPTALGALPSDLVLRQEVGLDFVVLGAACAPGGNPTPGMTVALSVGGSRRTLLATGDRAWVGEGEEARPTDPVPFTRMPLTWGRAFGGECDVWVDEHTRLPVQHAGNPQGLGLDVAERARALAQGLGAAEGFPRYEYDRRLPNIEDPRVPVTRWIDDPVPYAWGVLPPGVETLYRLAEVSGEPAERAAEHVGAGTGRIAHPDLRFDVPAPGTPIVLEGCRPEGRWWFPWPPMRPQLDYVIADRAGTSEMEPVIAVLLPEEGRITITYRLRFRFGPFEESSERSLRVRLE